MIDEVEKLSANAQHPPSNWEKFVPWYLTAISAVLLVGIGWFILSNIYWLRGHMFTTEVDDLSYRAHQYFLLISSIRRSAGLFAGIALMLLGVGIVFYVARSSSKLDMNLHGVSLGIVTASPGIIAMALGSFLIAHNTASKDLIPIFGTSDVQSQELQQGLENADAAFDALMAN